MKFMLAERARKDMRRQKRQEAAEKKARKRQEAAEKKARKKKEAAEEARRKEKAEEEEAWKICVANDPSEDEDPNAGGSSGGWRLCSPPYT